MNSNEMVKIAINALEEKKAENIRVIDISKVSVQSLSPGFYVAAKFRSVSAGPQVHDVAGIEFHAVAVGLVDGDDIAMEGCGHVAVCIGLCKTARLCGKGAKKFLAQFLLADFG